MNDSEVSRAWIIQAGDHLHTAVIRYRDLARHFCTTDLGMDWPLHARDSTYFAEKMRERRRQKKERLERLRALIPRRQCWEEPESLAPEGGGEADAFLTALLAETRDVQPAILSMARWLAKRASFDLDAAQQHLLAHIEPAGTNLRHLPPLVDDSRLDLIFKFIAAVFLQHAGVIQIHQPESDTILLLRPEMVGAMSGTRAVEGAT